MGNWYGIVIILIVRFSVTLCGTQKTHSLCTLLNKKVNTLLLFKLV